MEASRAWHQSYDRIILTAVKCYGETQDAFYEAWVQMGGEHKAPFTKDEIMARYQWLNAKFLEMANARGS